MRILGEGEKRLTNGFGIWDDIGDVPIDEIMALGLAISAAAATGLALDAIIETRKLQIREAGEETPESRYNKLMAIVALVQASGGASKELLEGAAKVVEEALVVGSVLPDDVG